jgi:UPF0755 protein
MRAIIGLFSVLILGAIFGFIAITAGKFIGSGAGPDSSIVSFEVRKGKSFQSVAEELEQKKFISNAFFFHVYARIKSSTQKIKVGEYGLSQNMTPPQVLEIITSGKSIGHPFTVSEGLNIFEIADLYQQQGFGTREQFLDACTDKEFVKQLVGEGPESLEGYLFPETYQITKFSTTKELLRSMVENFQQAYAQAIASSKIQGLSKHQIVTLASIIEKETGAPEERPLISSIFHNRLKKNMLLQTDPTIIYGISEREKKTVLKISKKDILTPTRYNTYVIKGLPPGPIANPGKEALLAAVNPSQSSYLFFVSQNNGTHIFSSTYEEHSKAVRKFQVDPKAREGKSWRDLRKKSIN